MVFDHPQGRGFVLCVSGPSGSGKTSLCDKLVAELDFAVRSISMTTRPQRPGERSGDDYIFVDHEKFEKLKEEGALLEWAEVFTNLYGTPREPVEQAVRDNKMIVVDIDTVGAFFVKKRMSDHCVTVFILPPSLEVLKERLQRRKQNTPEDLERRLKEAERETSEAPGYEYRIENRDFDQAFAELKKLAIQIQQDRAKKA